MQLTVPQIPGAAPVNSMQPQMRFNTNIGLQSGNLHQPAGQGMQGNESNFMVHPRTSLTGQDQLPINRAVNLQLPRPMADSSEMLAPRQNTVHNGSFPVVHHQEDRNLTQMKVTSSNSCDCLTCFLEGSRHGPPQPLSGIW
eukprot:764414-Hanusia_phi.AAC.5